MELCDVLIVGAGPGGLAAAASAKRCGAQRVIVLERNTETGGILGQCIHDGFGLIRYGEQLSGPEYASRAEQEAKEACVEFWLGNIVTNITEDRVVTAVSRKGLRMIKAGAIILATGCRERTRGAISIPGTRPAGVFTAGVVQNLINMHNVMIGKRVVILGSGDIGLIMARRLTLEGAVVKAVIEAGDVPSGLARNISQCLYDYNIPIYTRHTVSRIVGEKKLMGVEISEADAHMDAVQGTAQYMECDALVLSVGLIPENEVAQTAGVELDVKTNGVMTDNYLRTNVSGIFACGNCKSVMDLADFVSEQGNTAGKNAVAFLRGGELSKWDSAEGTTLAKGFPAPDSVTCTLCPNGCQVIWNQDAQRFEGNLCPRGTVFAEREKEHPKRTLTSTVRVAGGTRPLVSVRSRQEVGVEELLPLCAELRTIQIAAPVDEGQLIHVSLDYDGNPIEIVATCTIPAQSGMVSKQ